MFTNFFTPAQETSGQQEPSVTTSEVREVVLPDAMKKVVVILQEVARSKLFGVKACGKTGREDAACTTARLAELLMAMCKLEQLKEQLTFSGQQCPQEHPAFSNDTPPLCEALTLRRYIKTLMVRKIPDMLSARRQAEQQLQDQNAQHEANARARFDKNQRTNTVRSGTADGSIKQMLKANGAERAADYEALLAQEKGGNAEQMKKGGRELYVAGYTTDELQQLQEALQETLKLIQAYVGQHNAVTFYRKDTSTESSSGWLLCPNTDAPRNEPPVPVTEQTSTKGVCCIEEINSKIATLEHEHEAFLDNSNTSPLCDSHLDGNNQQVQQSVQRALSRISQLVRLRAIRDTINLHQPIRQGSTETVYHVLMKRTTTDEHRSQLLNVLTSQHTEATRRLHHLRAVKRTEADKFAESAGEDKDDVRARFKVDGDEHNGVQDPHGALELIKLLQQEQKTQRSTKAHLKNVNNTHKYDIRALSQARKTSLDSDNPFLAQMFQ